MISPADSRRRANWCVVPYSIELTTPRLHGITKPITSPVFASAVRPAYGKEPSGRDVLRPSYLIAAPPYSVFDEKGSTSCRTTASGRDLADEIAEYYIANYYDQMVAHTAQRQPQGRVSHKGR